MYGVVEYCSYVTLLNYFTRIHHRDTVTHLCNNAKVMRDENDSYASIFLEFS